MHAVVVGAGTVVVVLVVVVLVVAAPAVVVNAGLVVVADVVDVVGASIVLDVATTAAGDGSEVTTEDAPASDVAIGAIGPATGADGEAQPVDTTDAATVRGAKTRREIVTLGRTRSRSPPRGGRPRQARGRNIRRRDR